MKSDDIPLHDIKPLMEVADYTLVWLSALTLIAAVVFLLSGYLLWKRWRKAHRTDERQRCYEALKSVDLDDTKQAAYAISRYGQCFEGDSPRIKEAYESLCARLSRYKYRPAVPPLDEETRSYYAIFVGMIDV